MADNTPRVTAPTPTPPVWLRKEYRVESRYEAVEIPWHPLSVWEGLAAAVQERTRLARNTSRWQFRVSMRFVTDWEPIEDEAHTDATTVKEVDDRDKTCPHGLHFNGYYCDECAGIIHSSHTGGARG